MERKKMILAGGLLLGAGALFLMLQSNRPTPPPMQTVEAPVEEKIVHEMVLFTTANVSRGARLSSETLEWRQWPQEAVLPNMVVQESRASAIEELDGSIVRIDLYEGEPVNEAKLVRAGDTGLMAALLAPGMRAVTTRVATDSAAGGFIMPGDKVDILLTQQLPRERGRDQANNVVQYATTTIFEDVKVLAMNQNYTTSAESPAAMDSVSFATFEMNPRDAEVLERSAEMGSISLTLRGLQPNGRGRSASRIPEVQPSSSTSIVTYRAGQQTQTVVRGQ